MKRRDFQFFDKISSKNLQDFQWSNLLDEWKKEAPLLYRILTTVAIPSSSTCLPIDHFPAVCVSGAILLKGRNIHMSAIHHLIGLVHFHGNLSKTVNYLDFIIKSIIIIMLSVYVINKGNCEAQPCVSHQAILSKMDEMAAGFELRIQQWQDCMHSEGAA